jgi:hypothetical protein
MLVTNFETGWLESPEGGSPVQLGVELQITNLADVPIAFLARFRVSLRNDVSMTAQSLRAVASGPVTASGPIIAPGPWTSTQLDMPIVLPPKNSGVVGLWPVSQEGRPERLAGYVELRVPPVRRGGGFEATAQAAAPVEVLLKAQEVRRRGAYFNMVRDLSGHTIGRLGGNDLLGHVDLPLATGRALNTIDAEGLTFSNLAQQVASFPDRAQDQLAIRGGMALDEQDWLPALLDLLRAAASDAGGADAVNGLLDRLDIGVRLRQP